MHQPFLFPSGVKIPSIIEPSSSITLANPQGYFCLRLLYSPTKVILSLAFFGS